MVYQSVENFFFSPSSIIPHWKLIPFLSARAAHVLMVSGQKRHFVLSSFSDPILQQVCVVNFVATTNRMFHNVSHLRPIRRPISICIQRLYLQRCNVWGKPFITAPKSLLPEVAVGWICLRYSLVCYVETYTVTAVSCALSWLFIYLWFMYVMLFKISKIVYHLMMEWCTLYWRE